jgi:23S rRNA pseudouridine2605 synthase
VRVNGREALLPERWILPRRDRVVVDGRLVGEDVPRTVIALHKPKGCVTTRADPGGRATVYDVLGAVGRPAPASAGSSGARGWVFPVGRLDRDTSGLLVLTNDHRLGQRLTDPEHRIPKTYHARVRGIPDREALRALREGLALDDATVTRPAQVRVLGSLPRREGLSWVKSQGSSRVKSRGSTWLEIVLTEGKNRQVRRMGAAVGHEVIELVRVAIGALPLGDLAPGEWRELGPEEVARLTRDAAPRSRRRKRV